jgi:DNA polymerase III subunit gamma/tau
LSFGPFTLAQNQPVQMPAVAPTMVAPTQVAPTQVTPKQAPEVQLAQPVAVQVATPAAAVVGAFDGNWPKLAAAVPLSGAARQLATASEMISYADDGFELRVPLKILADSANVSKLKEALSQHFGRLIRVSVSVGAVQGPTAAALADANRVKRQQAASDQVDADPFVQSVLKEFGGSVVPGSIRPTDEP